MKTVNDRMWEALYTKAPKSASALTRIKRKRSRNLRGNYAKRMQNVAKETRLSVFKAKQFSEQVCVVSYHQPCAPYSTMISNIETKKYLLYYRPSFPLTYLLYTLFSQRHSCNKRKKEKHNGENEPPEEENK